MTCNDYTINGIASIDYVGCVVSAVSGTLQSQIFKPLNIYLRDEKSSGTGGGTAGGGYETRVLNTISVDETGLVSLSSNQFTLPSGTYTIQASAPIGNSGDHKLILRNVSDSANTLIGTCEAQASPTRSWLFGRFSIAASKTFSIQHYNAGGGQLGIATNDGTIEVYTTVHLQKIV